MKESKLVQMQNKLEALGNAMNRVIQELGNLKDLSIGTMELVKNFPEYESALEKLKKDVTEKQEKQTKEKK
jgi:predicted ATP-grasp superfamily ATP-dependent carboligase|tara:strand:- start:178 stop:390 length:213 start_codon:yes stop_codon:yes gene_type:complete